MRVINAYVLAHAQQLPDGRLSGLQDAIALIRSYFLGLPSSLEETLQLLNQLDSRSFEHLVDELYRSMRYETRLTPVRKDGGRDIDATREDRGHRTSLRIECKNWSRPVGVEEVRALYGVIEDEKIEKGLIVGTRGFTSRGPTTAAAFAARNSRLELVPGERLVRMLSELFGRGWPSRVDQLIDQSKVRQATH
ncbi:restriction endonuclease [Geodermatophilus sabuli]